MLRLGVARLLQRLVFGAHVCSLLPLVDGPRGAPRVGDRAVPAPLALLVFGVSHWLVPSGGDRAVLPVVVFVGLSTWHLFFDLKHLAAGRT